MANISLGTTDVKICARALVNIGMSPIDNLEGDDDVTLACSLLYPMVKKEVLCAYPWWASKGKKQLGRLTNTPTNEYRYGFQLPSGRISGPLAIYNSGDVGAQPIKEWDIQGDVVLSDQPALWGDFQFDIDESRFPPYIENLTIYILSARLAESLTDDSSKADKYDFIAFGTPGEKRWGGYFEIARSIDSRFRPNQSIKGFSLVDARGS
jgi:hypothetical protein